MLILGRNNFDTLIFTLSDDADPNMTIRELFADGPMTINFIHKNSHQQIGIEMPKEIKVMRGELVEDSEI